MPLKKGHSQEVVSSNIKELVKAGHKPKQAIAISLAEARKYKKMAIGGMVENDADLDEEHERSMEELMIQGDQPPIANPEVESEEMSLAKRLHEAHEAEEYAMGGMVEAMDGDEMPEPHEGGMSVEPMSDENREADEEHSQIEGVPMSMALSDEAKKALDRKKKMRRFS